MTEDHQSPPPRSLNLKSKAALALALLFTVVILTALLLRASRTVKAVPLQFGGASATYIGYQFSHDTRFSGKIISKPHSLTHYLIVAGEKTLVPASDCDLVITHNFPMLWIPRPSVPIFQHEVRLIRKKVFHLGQFAIPVGTHTEIWTTRPMTNSASR